jgi:hypothetical protein
MRAVHQRKEITLNHVALTASVVLVVVLTLALAREVRLRRALQRLLKQLLSFWRNRDEKPVARRGDADADDDADDDGGLH